MNVAPWFNHYSFDVASDMFLGNSFGEAATVPAELAQLHRFTSISGHIMETSPSL